MHKLVDRQLYFSWHPDLLNDSRVVLYLLTSYFDQRLRSRCMSRALFRPSSASIPMSCRNNETLFQVRHSDSRSNPGLHENNSRPRHVASHVSPSFSCVCAAKAVESIARRSVAFLSIKVLFLELFYTLYILSLTLLILSFFFILFI